MKKRTKKTRNALVASAVALTLSCALLLGTTFAWFTDSVTNKGNVIQAGNLSISATAYSVKKDATEYTITGVNGGNPFGFDMTQGQDLATGGAIITEDLWEPGISDAKLITVQNNGTLATKIQLSFTTQNTDANGGTSSVKLQDALWFDFVQVDANGTTAGNFEKRPMSQLQSLASQVPVTLKKSGDSVSFILVYGMNEDAGNEYQNLKFSADVTVMATQAPVEPDGFNNNQYDADATFGTVDVTLPDSGNAEQNGAALAEAIAKAPDNATVVLPAATYKLSKIDLGNESKNITIKGEEGATLQPVGNTGADTGAIVVTGADGASLTVENVTITGNGANEVARGICVSDNGNKDVTLTVKDSKFEKLMTGIYLGATTNANISGCTFTDCQAGIGGTEHLSGTLMVSNCTFSSNVAGAETIGWAGTGKLVIAGCTGCDAFMDYTQTPAAAVPVTNGNYSN